jgi:hypothetical protein
MAVDLVAVHRQIKVSIVRPPLIFVCWKNGRPYFIDDDLLIGTGAQRCGIEFFATQSAAPKAVSHDFQSSVALEERRDSKNSLSRPVLDRYALPRSVLELPTMDVHAV